MPSNKQQFSLSNKLYDALYLDMTRSDKMVIIPIASIQDMNIGNIMQIICYLENANTTLIRAVNTVNNSLHASMSISG